MVGLDPLPLYAVCGAAAALACAAITLPFRPRRIELTA
jgi:hypothetical protein